MSSDRFVHRHIGPREHEIEAMLDTVGAASLDKLIGQTVPAAIRLDAPPDLPPALDEAGALQRLQSIMSGNRVLRSMLGLGYANCHTPPVIQRNLLENPGWYTAYTPYQAEIAQGRLEALMTFQTLVTELTGLDVANASLLDEGTALAEALAIAAGGHRDPKVAVLSQQLHPHALDVARTRLEAVGSKALVTDPAGVDLGEIDGLFAVACGYPNTRGEVHDLAPLVARAHDAGALAIVTADPLALCLLTPPGALGADICVGNLQRFGVPLGFGGPHAAFIAVRDALKRRLPGRLIGLSKDSAGRPAYRLSLQTREQHIRRDKATSNICTAQVLLAVISAMYAVWHGPQGLQAMARRVHGLAVRFAAGLPGDSAAPATSHYFDTVCARVDDPDKVIKAALGRGYNLRRIDDRHVGVTFDETSTGDDLGPLWQAFGAAPEPDTATALEKHDGDDDTGPAMALPGQLLRDSGFLPQQVFHRYRSETSMMRYLRQLEHKDIALNRSMIPLGSCTMKLNAAAEMTPLSWTTVGGLHPFAPLDQAPGYLRMFTELEQWLGEITGLPAVSLQPNAGSQGEFAGLLAIRAWQRARGQGHRHVCLIPASAHGTNPASAVMAGFTVVGVRCDNEGNIDRDDLAAKIGAHAADLAALMITYPSTHGVYEEGVRELCALVHDAGGQVYMDGANLNAQVGLTSPAMIGADVCHLNLHKTFCIPHGGGGPGVGPIAAAPHLAPYLPGHRLLEKTDGVVCSAPWGSASITTISWMYLAMMGADGLRRATEVSILNANYMARRLEAFFPVLYRGRNQRVAHECILDLRGFKSVSVEDIAKRLMDFGFHAPTMSWPVPGTLMIEPTESESKDEIDRFCEAMIAIHGEIMDIEQGRIDPQDNPLKNAPHTAAALSVEQWPHPYSRQQAVFPLDWVAADKYWPPVGRIENAYGDRNLVCSCDPVEV